ncbi:MAG TPA: hypothetical protein VHJ78_10795 [Actinomycetota bacterium]|nr:hypothetical protein [Actinomycetota bacterium]
MPVQQSKRAIFLRWLWLVYLPLGLLSICLLLMVFRVLEGGILWLVGVLAAYCVVPMRLLLETKRKGLELPKPPGMAAVSPTRRPRRPPARPLPAEAGPPPGETATARVAPPPVPPQIRRRRAVAGVLGIGVMCGIGGLLFIIGMGRASSGSLGLALIGIGGFLMLLSVTLPTFKIVDIVVRAIGRLLTKKGPPPNRSGPPRRPEPAE